MPVVSQTLLRHTSSAGRPAVGTSRSRCSLRPCELARAPHPGQSTLTAVVPTSTSSSPPYSPATSTTTPSDRGRPAGLVHCSAAPASAEPKTLRYRLLSVPARLTRGQRRRWPRLPAHWLWSDTLAAAIGNIQRMPLPPLQPG